MKSQKRQDSFLNFLTRSCSWWWCVVFTFFSDEWKGPGEDVHEVGQPVGVGGAVELADVHDVVLVLEYGRLVVVHVQVVRGGEDGD